MAADEPDHAADADQSPLVDFDEPATYSLSPPVPRADAVDAPPTEIGDPPHHDDREVAPADVNADDEPAPAGERRGRRRRKRRRRERVVPEATLTSALWYPFREQGAAVLAAYAALLAIFQIFPLFGVLVLAYVGLLFLETANYTLENIDAGPRFPGIEWQALQAGLFSLTAMLIGMAPLLAGKIVLGWFGATSPVWDLLLVLFPTYYTPMAYLVLADVESERGLNPLLVLQAIGRIPGSYLTLVTLGSSAFLVPTVTLALLEVVPVVSILVRAVLWIYMMVVLMRAIGLLYLRRGIDLRAGRDGVKANVESQLPNE